MLGLAGKGLPEHLHNLLTAKKVTRIGRFGKGLLKNGAGEFR